MTMIAATLTPDIRPWRARLLAAATCGALALALGGAQAAAPSDDAPSVRVHYDDLNLASPEGARTLYRRIVAAAHAVCPQEDMRDLERYGASLKCQSTAIEQAVRAIHDPRLAALYSTSKG
jgi:UrcA family protein